MEFVNRQKLTAKAFSYWRSMRSIARLKGSHLAEFLPSTVGRSLEFVAVKKFGKKLGTENHNNKWIARGELNFIFIRRNHNVGIYSFV